MKMKKYMIKTFIAIFTIPVTVKKKTLMVFIKIQTEEYPHFYVVNFIINYLLK